MAHNGWLFWPDGEGMDMHEMTMREVTNWCEHAFYRVGASSDSLGGMPSEEDNAKEDEVGPYVSSYFSFYKRHVNRF